METIYLDPVTFHCSRTSADGMIPFETDFFNGKCDAFVEGYYAIPAGQSLTVPDGRTFEGEMIAPWKNYSILEAYQQQYEQMLPEMEDMKNALAILEVSADG